MKSRTISVKGSEVAVVSRHGQDYICLTDMLKAKDGDFFVADWLRNRNTVEFLGIWETVYNPVFNSGEFATIKSHAGLNSYKISVKDWVEKTNAIGLHAKAGVRESTVRASSWSSANSSSMASKNGGTIM